GLGAFERARVAPSSDVASSPAPALTALSAHIQHVVVFYQENHSFDETLGKFCLVQAGRCEGYVGPVRLKDGSVVEMTNSPDVVPNVGHDVASQNTVIDGGAMDGWGEILGCRRSDGYRCLNYYTPSQIPNLAALASNFVVSDRTFSMSNSPSWGGHVYAVAATLDNFTGENPVTVKGQVPGRGWGCPDNKVSAWIDPVTKVQSLQPSCIPAKPGTLDP